MMRSTILAATAALCLAGCSFGADKATAEAAVTQFHQMLDAGRFHDIYVGASDDFRASGSEAGMARFLGTIHDRLGSVQDATEHGWRVNYTNGRTVVTLNYVTHFTRGDMGEDFTFHIAAGSASLVGYHVRSEAIVAALRDARPTAAGGARPSVIVEPDGKPAPPAAMGGK
jgi:hypothetical protein